MVRATPDAEHLEARVTVPDDAWMMDFVFSSGVEEGAVYDNKGGRDYHVPVEGTAEAPPLHVVHISVEMAPIAKVGGLGDVVVALARAVQDNGGGLYKFNPV
jgi:starch synthase